jgi:hypothetical protein
MIESQADIPQGVQNVSLAVGPEARLAQRCRQEQLERPVLCLQERKIDGRILELNVDVSRAHSQYTTRALNFA